MQWHKIYKKIQKQLEYKNPLKIIIYIDVCVNCQQHLSEKIFFSDIAQGINQKAIVLDLTQVSKQTIINEIQCFLSKDNCNRNMLIIFNDDTFNPYNSCIKAITSLQNNLKQYTKAKIKIEITSFCFKKSPYCYIRSLKLIDNIEINEQILFFDVQRVCNKKTQEENNTQIKQHQNFVISLLSAQFKTSENNIQILFITNNIENYNQYLKMLKNVVNYEFLIIYYNTKSLHCFLEMNNINAVEVTNQISITELYKAIKLI